MRTQKKKLEFPSIPVKFHGRFPEGHVNDVKGWNFPKQEVIEASQEGRMITMDLDMGGSPKCSLRCSHCFNPVLKLLEKRGELLADADVRRVVQEAKELGLRTIKIIGPGEPLEEKSLLGFLEFLTELEVQPMIFTKGAILGNERRARRIHGIGPEELARLFRDEFNVSFGFGANSFDPATQAKVVKRNWYPEARNRALELLTALGFNDYIPGEPTRLALVLNPIIKDNIDEIFEVYQWARLRNIYVVSSPLMVAGSSRNASVLYRLIPDEKELFEVYTKINSWAIEKGIYELEDLKQDGIAAYVGGCPCQQLGLALFVRRDGIVLRCPGNDASVQGNVKKESLQDIWYRSENYRVYRGRINVQCPPKQQGGTFPEKFFEKVLEEVRKHFQCQGSKRTR